MEDLTSEFGMGSGISPPLSTHPIWYIFKSSILVKSQNEIRKQNPKPVNKKTKKKADGKLVLVSSTYRYAYTPNLSNS